MRKISFITAVISALALVCAACVEPLREPESFDDGMVRLSVGTGGSNSRTLNHERAVNAADYYEVVFEADGKYYRASGYMGNNLPMTLPQGNYQNKAVVFAGRSTDRILLGVGTIAAINGVNVDFDDSETFYIGVDTETVQFTLTALKANLQDGALTGAETGYDPANMVSLDNRLAPYFHLNPGEDYDLTYTVGWHVKPAVDPGSMVFVHQSYDAARSLTSWGLSSGAGGVVGGKRLEPRDPDLAPGTTLAGLNYQIPLHVSAPDYEGWSFLNFSFPVSALSGNTAADGGTGGDVWYIRGGLENSRLDTAEKEMNQDSQGGGMVFAVGNPEALGTTSFTGGWGSGGSSNSNIVLMGYPGQFRVYYIDGTEQDSDTAGNIVTPAGKTIYSIEALGGKTFTGGDIYIGRASGAGTVKLNFENTGSGTYALKHRAKAGGYIPIGTYAEFQLIGKDAGTRAKTYKQEADLDLLGKTGAADYGADPDDRNWTPVGTDTARFTGTFDGNGKTISNIYIYKEDFGTGLFGTAEWATLRNITIASGSIRSTLTRVGGIAGIAYDTVIEGCSNAAAVTGTGYVGGITGSILSSSRIRNSYNSGAISGGSYGMAGGIAGANQSSSTITACYNTGTVTVTGQGPSLYIGGLVGANQEGHVTDCYWLDLSSDLLLDPLSASEPFGANYNSTLTGIYAFGPGSNWPTANSNWTSNPAWGDPGSWNPDDYGRDSTFPKLAWQ